MKYHEVQSSDFEELNRLNGSVELRNDCTRTAQTSAKANLYDVQHLTGTLSYNFMKIRSV